MSKLHCLSGWEGFAIAILLLSLARAASADTIYTTKDATNVGQRSARMNGQTAINCSQGGVTMKFEFGLELPYDNSISSVPMSAAGNAGTVATFVNINGLSCSTTYHFRHSGTECETTTQGEDRTFTTLPCLPPEPPTNLMATAGNQQATVTFTAANDRGAPVTGYTVTSNPSGGIDSDVGTTGLSHTITGLTNGVAYTFAATATNASGTSSQSDPSNQITPAVPPDMTVLPDMTVPHDMTVQPDLVTATDMKPDSSVTAADMTGSPDMNINIAGGSCSMSAQPVSLRGIVLLLLGIGLLLGARRRRG